MRVLSLQFQPEVVKAIIETRAGFHLDVACGQGLPRKLILEKDRNRKRVAEVFGQRTLLQDQEALHKAPVVRDPKTRLVPDAHRHSRALEDAESSCGFRSHGIV